MDLEIFQRNMVLEAVEEDEQGFFKRISVVPEIACGLPVAECFSNVLSPLLVICCVEHGFYPLGGLAFLKAAVGECPRLRSA